MKQVEIIRILDDTSFVVNAGSDRYLEPGYFIDEGLEESFNSYEEFEDFLYGDEPWPPKLSKKDSAEKQKIIQEVNHLHEKFNHHLQQKEIDQILKEFN